MNRNHTTTMTMTSPNKGRSIDEELIRNARVRFQLGETWVEIAQAYGVSANGLRDAVARYVPPPRRYPELSWLADAACAEGPAFDLMSVDDQLAICRGSRTGTECPVRAQCLEWGLASPHGAFSSPDSPVYGGLTPAETHALQMSRRHGLPPEEAVRHERRRAAGSDRSERRRAGGAAA